jgi:hypothetical protein
MWRKKLNYKMGDRLKGTKRANELLFFAMGSGFHGRGMWQAFFTVRILFITKSLYPKLNFVLSYHINMAIEDLNGLIPAGSRNTEKH